LLAVIKNISLKSIIYIFTFLVLISCNQNNTKDNFDDENENNKKGINEGLLGKYIKPDYTLIPDTCLNKITSSLIDILWDKDQLISVAFGINFTPRKVINPEIIRNNKDATWIAFELLFHNEDGDTTYFNEAYLYESWRNEFKPCHFREGNFIYIDSLICIVPDLKKLNGNCLLKVTNENLDKGVWREVDEEHNLIIDENHSDSIRK
jgi:hypothetical protein